MKALRMSKYKKLNCLATVCLLCMICLDKSSGDCISEIQKIAGSILTSLSSVWAKQIRKDFYLRAIWGISCLIAINMGKIGSQSFRKKILTDSPSSVQMSKKANIENTLNYKMKKIVFFTGAGMSSDVPFWSMILMGASNHRSIGTRIWSDSHHPERRWLSYPCRFVQCNLS